MSEAEIKTLSVANLSQWLKTWLPIIISGLVLLAVIAQALIYKRQLEVMASGERAYLGFTGMKVTQLAEGRPIKAFITLENIGKTPAWNLTTDIKVYIAARPQFEDLDFGSVPLQTSFMPPGMSKDVNFMGVGQISAKDIADINAGVLKLITIGEVRYRDFQGEDRVYPFCVIFEPEQKIFNMCLDDKRQPN